MKISVDELKLQPGQRLTFEFKEMSSGTAAVEPVTGQLTISLNLPGIKLTGQVATLLKLQCDRCLRPFFQSLSLDLDERFVSRHFFSGENKEHELLRDDFVELLPESGVLDISDIVYQAVTLATPSYCLCGSECPGPPQSPAAGAASQTAYERNQTFSRKSKAGGDLPAQIDPRWKNLKTLLPKQDSQENS